MSDQRLDVQALLDLGERAVTDFVALVRDLDEADGDRPTDLAGWTVRGVVAHTAHLEAVLAGAPEETVEVPADLAHVRGAMGVYTERGVIARRGQALTELTDELVEATTRRTAAGRTDPPDLDAPAPGAFGDLGWTWRTLLSNRPLDVWMHEQDARRATTRPGGLTGPVAEHVVGTFARSWGLVVAKRAKAAPGKVVALEITGPETLRVVVTVDQSGRGVPAPDGAAPDLTLRTDVEGFIVLGGGRRPPSDVPVQVTGDPALAARILAVMTLTP